MSETSTITLTDDWTEVAPGVAIRLPFMLPEQVDIEVRTVPVHYGALVGSMIPRPMLACMRAGDFDPLTVRYSTSRSLVTCPECIAGMEKAGVWA